MNAVPKTRIDQLTRLERLALGQIGRTKTRRVEWKFSPQMLRLREIEKVIASRHGSTIPDPEDTDDRETCLAYVQAAALALSGQDITAWCSRWAPWARKDEVLAIEQTASRRRRMMTSDGVAGLIGVTWKERTDLSLKTIGASDIAKPERRKLAKERKQERDRNSKAEARRASGKKDRHSYVSQSLSTQKPWEAEGISRRTWERRRVASPSRIEIYMNGDTLASNETAGGLPATPPPISKPIPDGVADRSEGLGDHPPAELQEAGPHGSGNCKLEEAA